MLLKVVEINILLILNLDMLMIKKLINMVNSKEVFLIKYSWIYEFQI